MSIIDSINEKYGRKVIYRTSDAPHRPKFRIPFSSMTLNRLTGGGVLVPRITHLYGPSSIYKSTGIYDLIGNAQRIRDDIPKKDIGNAKRIALIDTEQSYSERYLEQCGVDINDPMFHIIDEFDNGDELVDIMVDLFKSREFMLICLDSLTTVLSAREDETQMNELIKLPGWRGKFTSNMFAKIHAANRGTTAMVFANQIRDDIGTQMSRVLSNKKGYSPTGGNAPKFYSTDIIELSQQTQETEAKYAKMIAPHGYVDRRPFTGNIISARIEKTRSSGQENMEMFFRYIPSTARVDKESEAIVLGMIDGIITNRGAFYYYQLPGMKEPERLAQGRDNLRSKLAEDQKLFESIMAAIEEKSRQIGAF